MTAYLVCITSGSGLPIFSRKKGSTENLPFSVIGSLNGVHMFGKPLNIEILDTITNDYCIAWKEFDNSIVIIGIASGCSKDVLDKVVESAYNAVVLFVGTEEIKLQRNIERLKKELRICYPIIDRLLDSLDCGDTSNKHSSDIVGYVETILCPENHLIQVVLDSFVECVDSMFGCIIISGKIAVATVNWWTLHPDEIRLLSLLAVSDNTANSKDIPIYLPYKSPTVAFRFIACTLIPEVQLCCLCGPTPVLNDIEHSVTLTFKSSTDVLNAAVQCSPRNFPNSCTVDGSILGLLLVNTKLGKFMTSKNPQATSKKFTSSSHRLDILRTFFYRTVIPFLNLEEQDDGDKNQENCNLSIGTETYWCSEYHKCHAAKFNENILCVLYNASVPTHAMNLITQKTLKQLISDKQVCW